MLLVCTTHGKVGMVYYVLCNLSAWFSSVSHGESRSFIYGPRLPLGLQTVCGVPGPILLDSSEPLSWITA